VPSSSIQIRNALDERVTSSLCIFGAVALNASSIDRAPCSSSSKYALLAFRKRSPRSYVSKIQRSDCRSEFLDDNLLSYQILPPVVTSKSAPTRDALPKETLQLTKLLYRSCSQSCPDLENANGPFPLSSC